MEESKLLNEREAAEYLSVTPRWIRRQRESRKLPFVKLGNLVRFRKTDLDVFIKTRVVSGSGFDSQEAAVLDPDARRRRKHSEETRKKIAESQRKAWKRRRKAASGS